MTAHQTLPGPTPTPVSQHFWDSATKHRLMFQRCDDCRAAVFPPRAHCPACWGTSLQWRESSGHGVVASVVVVHRPGHPAFASLAPFKLALVDLDEGFRMLSRLVVPEGDDTPVGTEVHVRWERSGEVTVPLFTPIRSDERTSG